MNIKKIAAFAAAVVMAAGIWTGIPTGTESVPAAVITAEAADTKLAAPANVKAKAGDGKVTLTWDKVKGADAYRVYMYNAETKKYEKCKLMKGTKATIKDLENGKTYKFKVAAAIKSGKTYKTGTASKAVSVTLKAEKAEMKKVTLTEKGLTGAWKYYDYLEGKKYSDGVKYDPRKPANSGELKEYTDIDILDNDIVMLTVYDKSNSEKLNEKSLRFFQFMWIDNGELTEPYDGGKTMKFSTYSYGKDKFLLVEANSGKDTYVFKKAASDKKQITDVSKLDGKWTCVDFMFNIHWDMASIYNPKYKYWMDELWFKSAEIKDGRINIIMSDGTNAYEDAAITKDKINGDVNYEVYEIDGEMYLLYEFNNGENNNVYVFKKN